MKFARGEDGIEAIRTGQEVQKTMNGTVPRFFVHRVPKEGSVDLHEMECVEIMVPGDLKSVSIRKVTEVEKQMFPDAYEAFKSGVEATVGGTALELFLGKDDPRIRELHYHRLHTVEQVSQISDTTIQALGMGFRELRDECSQFVERQTGNVALAAQNEELASQLAAMQKQLDNLAPSLAPMPESETDGADGGDIDPGSQELATALNVGTSGATGDITTPAFTLKPGYQGAMSVINAQGVVVLEEVGAGAKKRCEDWIAQQKEQGHE